MDALSMSYIYLPYGVTGLSTVPILSMLLYIAIYRMDALPMSYMYTLHYSAYKIKFHFTIKYTSPYTALYRLYPLVHIGVLLMTMHTLGCTLSVI